MYNIYIMYMPVFLNVCVVCLMLCVAVAGALIRALSDGLSSSDSGPVRAFCAGKTYICVYIYVYKYVYICI